MYIYIYIYIYVNPTPTYLYFCVQRNLDSNHAPFWLKIRYTPIPCLARRIKICLRLDYLPLARFQ